MEIKERKVTVREVAEKYSNNDEEGVRGYNNRLDIRPKYQREFIYKDEQRDEVIRSVLKGLPLNVIYWAKTGEDSYEVLDGQQRTISLCEYIMGTFSVDGRYFDNLPDDLQQKILDYKLFVYVCDGTDSEKLDWFKIINIAGVRLTDQELRNAVYAGPWVTDAKKYFSKTNCAAYSIGKDYLNGKSIRQEYLETALSWVVEKEKTSIEKYMGKNQYKESAKPLWLYFRTVIEWVEEVFPKYRKEMKGLPWGIYYNKHKNRTDLNSDEIEGKIHKLMQDEDVTNKKGVYKYILTGDEKLLNIRAFDKRDKSTVYERQKGICPYCKGHFTYEEMEGDHIKPWSKGGKTTIDNLQMVCAKCNMEKRDR